MSQICFVLPVGGGSGGAHSIAQEVTAMRQLGTDAAVMVNAGNFRAFRRRYARLKWIDEACFAFDSSADLGAKLAGTDVVVATTNTSAHTILEAKRTAGKLRVGYYVQDYEPLFYEVESESWKIALSSFSIHPECTYFAKTRWLRDLVHAVHDIEVAPVVPSIDHTMYRPERRVVRDPSRIAVCAMVRPSTPRRAPHRTMRILGRIAAHYGTAVDVFAFGAGAVELRDYQIGTYGGIEVLGELSQSAVAELLQQSDFFLDLSDYQAFGRTAAEAMACGTIALAPAIGGSSEFIRHGVNSFLVDTANEADIIQTIDRMFSMTAAERRQMSLAALEAVSGYTPIAAAISELRVLGLA